MSKKETKVETLQEEVSTDEAGAKKPATKKNKLILTLGIIAGVLVIVVVGFLIWHEQPSFCAAICHTPMDQYLVTYDQEENTQGVDKWGNTVSNTSSMLAVTHKAEGVSCMGCHVPTLSEQISEGLAWISGNYEVVANDEVGFAMVERTLSDLTAAKGTEGTTFCLSSGCHDMTRDELTASTASMTFNPHDASEHGEFECSTCHKAHRASVMVCANCHGDAEIPAGWVTETEAEKLSGLID